MNYVATELKRTIDIKSIVSIHYFEYTSDFTYPGESHDFWEMIYCDKGALHITAGEKSFNLGIGQAFLHHPSQFHNVEPANNEPANSVVLSFYSDSQRLQNLADSPLNFDNYARTSLFSIIREAKASFENPLGRIDEPMLLRKPSEEVFAAEQVIQNYAELLLIHLIRKTDYSTSFPELPREEKNSRLANEISRYMSENLSKKITFSEITRIFSVSPTTLKKLFKSYYRCGTMEYLTSLRIERAKELLRGGKHTCTEISSLCGFCSIHHFSKVFKEKCGISPTEYLHTIKAMLDSSNIKTDS
ncbi:MAG: helix-turn-helix domain-containing protein [Ruminococcaceae bacterium]|nr:helix-turn-helix domain-containing protein [Oscillospiraceae bacterium]